jgi:nucleotide-binding universal stress UspA family protein
MMASDSSMSRAEATFHPVRRPFGVHQRRILCASDFSRHSTRAVKAAAVLANRLGAQLMLLHVASVYRAETSAEAVRERLRAQLGASGLSFDSIPVLAVREGNVARAIAQLASDSAADLIVLGAQSRRALAPVLGTTAENIIARAQCPVLVVRSKGTLNYDRVVIAAELERSFTSVMHFANRWSFLDASAVSVVHGFLSPYQGPLYAEGYDVAAARRHVNAWKRTARTYLQDMLRVAGIEGSRFDMRIEEHRPLRILRAVLGGGSARSLVVMGTSAHNALTRIVKGSLVNDVLMSFDCDVLICPQKTPGRTVH